VDAGACSGGAWSAAAAGDVGALLDRRRAYDRLLARLRRRERAMLGAYLDGATLAEIGAEHGVTRERVRQVLRTVGQRHRALMRQVLGR
jgi:DNA-directed RNA polymerase sigma subunit (sigma70/sigma32)